MELWPSRYVSFANLVALAVQTRIALQHINGATAVRFRTLRILPYLGQAIAPTCAYVPLTACSGPRARALRDRAVLLPC